jgi:hypothetical protein
MNRSTIGVFSLEPVHAIQKKNGKPQNLVVVWTDAHKLVRQSVLHSARVISTRARWAEGVKIHDQNFGARLVGPRQLVLSFSCYRSTSKSFFFGKASDQVLASLSPQCMPNQCSCIPNGGTIQPKFWKSNGYNPNNMILPKFWPCPWFGNAKNW